MNKDSVSTGNGQDGLAQLREHYPAWEISTRWTAAASGPDRRHFLAHQDGVTLSAWSASALAAEIARVEWGLTS